MDSERRPGSAHRVIYDHAVSGWYEILPVWLGGVGGLCSAGVAAAAYVKSTRTQGGIAALTEAANNAIQAAPSAGSAERPANVSPVTWTQWEVRKGNYMLRNDSTNTGAVATLTGFRDASPRGDDAVLRVDLPITLEPGQSVPFLIERSMASPSVTPIQLSWTDEDGTERQTALYVI